MLSPFVAGYVAAEHFLSHLSEEKRRALSFDFWIEVDELDEILGSVAGYIHRIDASPEAARDRMMGDVGDFTLGMLHAMDYYYGKN